MSGPPDEALPDHDGLGAAIENAAFVMALRGRGTRDTAVLRAMEQVPRARFAPAAHRHLAQRDLALPLPCGASMTAPSTVATMLALLRVEAGMQVLEIGTGSGYVTALLLQLGAGGVTSLERYATLADAARRTLGDARAVIRQDDGLAEAAGSFDRILVHGRVAAPPPAWSAALRPDGRLVAGSGDGRLLAVARTASGLRTEAGPALRLAPLVPGRARVL
ncbi:protein-L-isoaspartate O-methyltransferase [uncultured Methylobacterium sp.]|uniref:protein-L-isoaspartate O-methyltransferase family protein n=1 Tax=uncultured Methylobacterium sp. TaxID=157278 RepID=UPI0035CAB386